MYICRVKTSKGFKVGRVLNGRCKVSSTSTPEEQSFDSYKVLCV